jgi:DNA-binding LacI/PurR family transcriptional regulator
VRADLPAGIVDDQMTRPPGMHDVARVARVSHQTVSRVLNNHPHVRPATRERVRDAIAELGYRRNAAARSLVTRRSSVVGLLTPRTNLFGPNSSMIAIEVAAREAGYFVSLASVSESSAEELRTAVEHFKDQAAEAVVLIAPAREWIAAARVVARDLPVVTMCADFRLTQPKLASVSMDNEAGGKLVTEHLIELGHRNIALLEGPATSPEAAARRRGWRNALRSHGLTADRMFIGDWSSASGHAAGLQMVAENLPTAVFSANDQMALGLLRAFAEAGVSVPGDVSVAGFDDIPEAAYFVPPLTTVRQEFPALAAKCLDQLDRMLQGEPGHNVRIRPRLVVRSSTSSAPAAVRSNPRGRRKGHP